MFMKRLIVILLAIASTISLYAQEQDGLSVESFLPSVNDLTARTKGREDHSGKACAVVKVLIPDSGVTFECGNIATMIVGDVAFNTNEYIVYLVAGPGGAKHLKVKHPKCQTIDVSFADYGFSTLEPRMTYTLVLKKPKEVNLEYQYDRLGASLTSVVVPGLGQMVFKNSYTKGAIILASEAVSIGGVFLCHSQSNKWRNQSNMAISASDKVNFMRTSDNWANARNICIGAAAAIWVYNMADVIFAKKRILDPDIIAMQPYWDINNNIGISLAYKF